MNGFSIFHIFRLNYIMSLARHTLAQLCPLMQRSTTSLARSLSTSITMMADNKETHTGQQFSKSDPRNARFDVTGLEKQVNEKWAIDLIAQVPPIAVNKRTVACDGGGGALGHPKVYINLDSGEVQTCPYCGMRFVFDPEAGEVDVRAACENPLGRCARAEE